MTLLIFPAVIIFLGLIWVLSERSRMHRRAAAILNGMTDPEETVEYIAFNSAFPTGKKKAMREKIESIESEGWKYLKASEASLKKTTISFGGGLNLHFVRERLGVKKT